MPVRASIRAGSGFDLSPQRAPRGKEPGKLTAENAWIAENSSALPRSDARERIDPLRGAVRCAVALALPCTAAPPAPTVPALLSRGAWWVFPAGPSASTRIPVAFQATPVAFTQPPGSFPAPGAFLVALGALPAALGTASTVRPACRRGHRHQRPHRLRHRAAYPVRRCHGGQGDGRPGDHRQERLPCPRRGGGTCRDPPAEGLDRPTTRGSAPSSACWPPKTRPT